MKDLIVLTADQNMLFLMNGLLPRFPDSLETIEFTFDVFKHPEHDAGCVRTCSDFLRPFINQYRFAIVILDFEGCGKEDKSRIEIETKIETNLNKNGWDGKSCSIVIQPELENWIWINSPHVSDALNWDADIGLFDWLEQNNYKDPLLPKPTRPKETLELVLKKTQKGRSSSIYKKIASNASFRNCSDVSFIKLKEQLISWFKK